MPVHCHETTNLGVDTLISNIIATYNVNIVWGLWHCRELKNIILECVLIATFAQSSTLNSPFTYVAADNAGRNLLLISLSLSQPQSRSSIAPPQRMSYFSITWSTHAPACFLAHIEVLLAAASYFLAAPSYLACYSWLSAIQFWFMD